MKRFIAALLMLGLLCIPLSGCKKSKKQVALCVPQNTAVDTQYLTSSLEKLGYQVTVFEEKKDQQNQILLIHQLYTGNYALIIAEPLISSSVKEILDSKERKNTPVIFLNYYGEIPQSGENVCFITGDPDALGLAQASSFAELPDHGDLNGDGTVCYAILAGEEENEEVSQQCASIEKSLFGASRLETRRCANPSEAASSACGGLLSTYGRDLEVIVCTDAELSAAAVAAVAEAGRQPGQDLYVIGAGESPDSIKLLQDKILSVTVAPERTENGNQIVQVAEQILNGDKFKDHYSLTYSPLIS